MARATTTPAIRARIAASEEPAAVLAGRFGVTLDTIYRWRGRTSFEDRSHTAHQLATTLTRAQELVAGDLRPGGHCLERCQRKAARRGDQPVNLQVPVGKARRHMLLIGGRGWHCVAVGPEVGRHVSFGEFRRKGVAPDQAVGPVRQLLASAQDKIAKRGADDKASGSATDDRETKAGQKTAAGDQGRHHAFSFGRR